MTGQTNVQIIGVKETVNALKAFEPDLLKRMNKEIRDSLGKVRDRAKGKYPGGSWSININNKKILGSIAASARGGLVANSWGKSAPGTKAAIFEFVGSRYSGNDPQVTGLISSLTRRYGQPGRFLWSAWDELGSGVLSDIEQAVRRAERDLQANLDAAGERY